jgi:cell wall-associated NlpC family hydrolase
LAFLGVALIALTFGAPVVSATADPEPSLTELKKQVESLYNEIETLTEEYNGQRERLKQATRSADVARKTLVRSQTDLASRRQKASLLAQNDYMMGGLSSTLALVNSGDPEGYLDRAATSYALEMEKGQEVAQVDLAIKNAQHAEAGAKAREAEVNKLVNQISDRRSKINKLVAKTESSLYRKATNQVKALAGGRARLDIPIVGQGKAAQAAKWAMTQQLKPYVWGAAGPSAFDCSGLVMWAFQKVGISLPHYTGDQWTAGTHIAKADLRPGDLVFFYSDVHHVGIYIGGGMMVHAPQTGDVVHVSTIGDRPFAGAVRIAD